MGKLQKLQEYGLRAIDSESSSRIQIPLDFDVVVFRQTFEYGVEDFAAEVGLFVEVFGLAVVALSGDYGLFTTANRDFFVSVRKADAEHACADLEGIRMCVMTADFDAAESHLKDRHHDLVTVGPSRAGSSVQRVLDVITPAGLDIELWEDPFPKPAPRS